MKTNTTSPHYKGFRFPSEIISHAVWLYLRFSLSFRDVEEIWRNAGSSSLMKRCGNGAANLVNPYTTCCHNGGGVLRSGKGLDRLQ